MLNVRTLKECREDHSKKHDLLDAARLFHFLVSKLACV